MVESVRDGLTTLSEIGPAVKFFFEQQPKVDGELKATVLTAESARKVLEKLLSALADVPWGDNQGCKRRSTP